MKNQIFNPFKSTELKPCFYDVAEPIKELGEYKVYVNTYASQIIAFRGVAITERVKISDELLEQLHTNTPPTDSSIYGYERCKEFEKKGIELYNKHFNK